MINNLFYLFSVVMLLSAIGVVFHKNTMYSLLFLILVFFSATGIFILFNAEFLALVLVILHVGAVIITMSITIMTLNLKSHNYKNIKWYSYMFLSIILGEIVTLFAVKSNTGQNITVNSESVDILPEVAQVLFEVYYYPFLIVGLFLLVTMMGVIMFTFTKQKNYKQQKLAKQSFANPSDYVELKKVKSGNGVDY